MLRTDAQKRTVARYVDGGWQDIADDHISRAAVLTTPIGGRWMDALVHPDGTVTFDRPRS